jgi:hypothetical protein
MDVSTQISLSFFRLSVIVARETIALCCEEVRNFLRAPTADCPNGTARVT